MERIKRQLTTCQGSGDASRGRELARIHCLAKELRLDRDAYEAVLQEVTGSRSAAGLPAAARRRVIAHFSAHRAENHDRGRAPATLAQRPMLRKVAALLADGGYPWSYGDALARRIAHVECLQFCSDAGLRKVVAALAYDQKRRAAGGGPNA